MYRVIEMYGDFEPWWFLEGWEEDIVAGIHIIVGSNDQSCTMRA